MANFIDKIPLKVQAGRGGNGVVSFRREKFVDRGGPNGGDGGKGGSIIFVGDKNLNTLQKFRFQKQVKAEDGDSGRTQNQTGKNAEDLIVTVPVGTQIFISEELIADIVHQGQKQLIARGGRGGFGNAHFKSSTRQAPRIAEKGEPGQKLELTLELKLLADVGLVGLPNVGKSSLLSVVSNAKPAIANYPFTTLIPHLGVVDRDGKTILMADIPGLIEGASQGKGLGDEFLRHIERTVVLIHMVDSWSENPVKDYQTVLGELASYKIDLSSKPTLVVLSKIDGQDKQSLAKLEKKLAKASGHKLYSISSHDKQGLEELLSDAVKLVSVQRANQQAKAVKSPKKVLKLDKPSPDDFSIEKTTDGWVITGEKIERFAVQTDEDSQEGMNRLRDIMQKRGINKELVRLGAKLGDKVKVADKKITF